jgi:hypothetical protein
MTGSFSAGGNIGYAYPLEEEDNDASMSYVDDSATLHSRATYHNPKEIYERAQQSSSNQVGSTLYNSSNNNNNEQPRRRPPNRALRFQNNKNNNNVNSFRSSSAQSSMQPHSAAMSSSFQSSSFNNSSSQPLTSSILSSSSSSQYYNQSTAATSMSMSGNPLHRVSIEQNEDSEVELNKDEIRQLIIDEDHAGTGYSEFYGNIIGGGASSVTLSGNGGGSTSSSFAPNSTSSIITPITSTSASSITSFHTNNNPLFELIKLTQSKQFRKSFFLSILFTLMALGTFLTIENVIHVKDVNAWIEPNSSNNKNDFGIQWSMGSDAPRPIINQERNPISSNIQDYIADWAIGTTFIPGIIDNYGSIALTDTTKFRDVPLFWGTEYADAKGVGGGSSMMESVLGSCLNLVQVSSVVGDAADSGGGGGGELTNVEVGDDGSKVGGGVGGDDYLQLSVVMNMGRKYINVDTTTKEGIERAKILALSSSGMADVIYTSLLQDASSIFTTLNQARMFVLIRHPVEREMARFRHLRREDYDKTKLTEWHRGKLQDMSYEEYAKSEFARDNWMTRELVNKRCINGKDEEGDACAPLNENDVNTAKEILRRKAVIGLYSDIIGAVQHFGRYFGWDNAQKGKNFEDATMYCFQSRILEGMRKDALGGDDLDPNDALEYSNAHATLMDKNKYDFELFTYAQTLYKYQIELS